MNSYNYLIKENELKCTAANERFHISGGVFPKKWHHELVTLSPAGSSVEAATTPSRL